MNGFRCVTLVLIVSCSLCAGGFAVAGSYDVATRELDVSAAASNSGFMLGHWFEHQETALEAQLPDDRAWVESRSELMNLGFSRQARWLRVRFHVSSPGVENHVWLFSLGTANARLVEVDHRLDGGTLARHRLGSGLPFDARFIPYRELAFPLQMLPGQHEVLMRIENHSTLSVRPSLNTRAYWLGHVVQSELFLGACLGLVGIFMLYNLAVFARLGDLLFGYFALSLAGGLAWLMGETGVASQFLYPGHPELQDAVLRMSLGTMLAGLLLFSRAFLAVPEWAPAFARVQVSFAAGIAFVFLFPVFRHFPVASVLAMFVALCICLIAAVRGTQRKIEGAAACLAGLSAFTIGLVAMAVRASGVQLDHPVVEHARELALISLGFVGSLALSSRLREARASSARALDAVAARSAFLASMSHEIRTPLNAIVGFADLMRSTHLQPEQKSFLDRIQSASRHLLDLVNDVLDFSKMEAGRTTLESNAIEIRALLGEMRDMFGLRAGQQGIAFRIEVAEGVRQWYLGDRLRLSQVLQNLISNALKFTAKGEVEVIVSSEAECREGETIIGDLAFAVRDTGIGIGDAERAKLFRPFTQADTSTTRQYGGTGLGLAICKQLVELMGGSMHLHSEPGKGSTFRFTIPMRVDPSGAVRDVQTTKGIRNEATLAEQLEGLRVLLVEDNATNQLLAKTMLVKCGVECRIASHGAEALDILQRETFDAIFMDCQMPVMDGYEAARAIRRNQSLMDVPLIAMTANAMAGDRERCLAAGMNDYVAKPVRMHDVVSVLIAWTRNRTRGVPAQMRESRQAVSM